MAGPRRTIGPPTYGRTRPRATTRPPTLRAATWNLERPRLGSHRKLPGLRAQIDAIGADVWILTETNDQAVDLSATHPYHASTIPVPGLHSPGERWTTIWSRFPLAALETYDPHIAACGLVDTPLGEMVIYGTVLPYHADRVATGEAKSWSEFHRVTPMQAQDWRRLRGAHPDARFCVAGDLNQSLDGRRWSGREWYGTKATRRVLLDALAAAELACVTGHDLVGAGHLTTRSRIDHLCFDAVSIEGGVQVGAWEAGRGDGVRLSDHNGVFVDLQA